MKFLLYLFLFYVVFRLVFGRFMSGGSVIKTKVYRYDTHHHYHYDQQKENEGKVTVNPKINQNKKGNDRNIGEYVDYEEVK